MSEGTRVKGSNHRAENSHGTETFARHCMFISEQLSNN